MIFDCSDIIASAVSVQNGDRVVNPLFFEYFNLQKSFRNIKKQANIIEVLFLSSVFW